MRWNADRIPLRLDKQRLPWGREDSVRNGRDALTVEHGESEGWETQPTLAVMDDGLPKGMAGDYYRLVGNAAVPQCAEIIGWMIREILEA